MKKNKKIRKKNYKNEADKLWAEIIKKKAGYKSEYSGKPGKQIGGDSILNAHHLVGKKSLFLRYSIENGICLTNGEHNFIAHNINRQEEFRKKVIEIKRYDIYEKLTKFKYKTSTSIFEYWLWLKDEGKKYAIYDKTTKKRK